MVMSINKLSKVTLAISLLLGFGAICQAQGETETSYSEADRQQPADDHTSQNVSSSEGADLEKSTPSKKNGRWKWLRRAGYVALAIAATYVGIRSVQYMKRSNQETSVNELFDMVRSPRALSQRVVRHGAQGILQSTNTATLTRYPVSVLR